MSDEPTLLDWIEQQMGIMNMAEGTLKHYQDAADTADGIWEEYADGKMSRRKPYEWDAWLARVEGSGWRQDQRRCLYIPITSA